MAHRPIHLLFILLLATPLMAQFERVLIPSVANEPIPGANGSSWITEIAGQNLGDESLTLFAAYCPFECPETRLGPHEVFTSVESIFATSPHGAVIQVRSSDVGRLALTARVRDLSRTLNTWGTELPVVLEHEVLETPITLLNVPSSARFRVTLRMYDFTWEDNEFVVRIADMQGRPLTERRVRAQMLPGQGLSYAVLSDLDVTGADTVLVTVTTTRTPSQFWAFASVTNNETQHVTIISPNRPTS
jgi:hypothetical protein